MELHSWRRDPWHEEEVEPLTLYFDLAIPSLPQPRDIEGEDFRAAAQHRWAREAGMIVTALFATLPAGLLDAMYAEFTQRMASILHVGHRQE